MKKKKETEILTCQECGKQFTKGRKWSKFCSSSCRHKNWINNLKEKANDPTPRPD
jgi:uncharacterized protein with PIN domain